ncbi:heavy metal transporter [Microbacterium flavum]|uniref:heavy metal transporter n=1 Tax=Microbacterium flavum TaxID=415216 RepID=UPI0024AD838E|nr:heavy metal transporter [Microbacterium flavum]
MTETPRRVRVTADERSSQRPTPRPRPAPRPAATRGIALPGASVDEAEAVYDRALRRSQLRLALGTVAGFVVVVVALTAAIALIPDLDRLTLWGVPLSWLLHAFAFYPVIIVFGVLYTRGAARNERRYRALRERE